MKAIIWTKYGSADGHQLQEIARKPTRVRILGTEFAGEIVSAGKDVTRFKPGDQVFGYTGLGMGTYAEYLCLSEKPSALASVMGIKPATLS